MSGEIDSRYVKFNEEWIKARGEVNNKIKLFIKDKNYGTEINDIGIICIIMKFDDKMESEGWFKERKLVRLKKKEADIRLRIDYDKFVSGDIQQKKLLLIDNVIKSIREIAKKAKKDFKAIEFENDILNLFELTVEDLLFPTK